MNLIKRLLSRDIGQLYEDIALKFLKKQGLKLLATNFNCRYGELDIIMADAETLVFVEVKYRRSRDFGGAVAAVTQSKQRKLIRTAQYYMQQNQLSHTVCRYDIVAIEGPEAEIQWIKNAFYAE